MYVLRRSAWELTPAPTALADLPGLGHLWLVWWPWGSAPVPGCCTTPPLSLEDVLLGAALQDVANVSTAISELSVYILTLINEVGQAGGEGVVVVVVFKCV